MKRQVFIIFVIFIISIGAGMMYLQTMNMSRYRLQDLERNGRNVVRAINYHMAENKYSFYPERIADVMSNRSISGEDRLYNPYSTSFVRILDIDSDMFEPGCILYVVTERNDRNLPTDYKLFMLGRKSDPFYDKNKAIRWQQQYMDYTGKTLGPDNVVMVVESDLSIIR